jgi:outer membrane protein assembly factor BamB
MKRFGGIAIMFLFILGGLGAAFLEAQDWPMYHYDLAHTGYSPDSEAPEDNTILWTYQTGGPVDSSPAVAGDYVYIGSSDLHLYCLDKWTGAVNWQYTVGGWVESSPAVADGKVYFLSDDGIFYALNASNGSLIWQKDISPQPYYPAWDWGSPAVHDGNVFIVSSNGILWSLDANTGTENWQKDIGGVPDSPIAVANGKVYTGTHNFDNLSPTLIAVDEATGATAWTYDYYIWHNDEIGFVNMSAPAIVDGDGDGDLEVYFTIYNWSYGSEDQFIALDEASGSELWTQNIGESSTSTPAYHNGRLFVGSDDGRLYALNSSSGAVIWTYHTGGEVWSAPTVSGDGRVCFGSRDHTVYCLDEDTGSLVWSYYTGSSRLTSSPALSCKILFIGNENGKVYAFGTSDEPPELTGVPGNATVECDSVPDPPTVTAEDVCGEDVPISYSQTTTPGTCQDSYTLTRTWTATDGRGNQATGTQVITVRDTTPPVLPPAPANATVECNAVPPAAQLTATDNCDPAPQVQFSETRTDGNCPDDYVLTRTWTATDRCNNAAGPVTQVITVRDTTPPVLPPAPANATVECGAVPPAAQLAATDNCDPDPEILFDETRTDGNCEDNYVLTRTWTATDRCNNTAGPVTQTITVRDTQAPVLSGVPSDTAAECDSVPPAAQVTATDNCDSAPLVLFDETRTAGDCPDNYSLTRSWTGEDRCNNTAGPYSQTVTVSDTTPPMVVCELEPVFEAGDEDEDGDADEAVEGLFKVTYSGLDNCAAFVETHGYVNAYGNDETCGDEAPDFMGYPVMDGDYVKLNCDAKKTKCEPYVYASDESADEASDEAYDVAVEITGPAFRLTVTGTDNCFNPAETECIQRCLDPKDCIHAMTLKNRAGDEKTFYWYELTGANTQFEVNGQYGTIHTSCSRCLMVGDAYGDLTITCIYAGEKLADECGLPREFFAAPCP